MDICGEHGDDVAFSGRHCPACSQIEDINREHQEAIDSLISDFDSEMADMRVTVEGLQDEIDDLNGKST